MVELWKLKISYRSILKNKSSRSQSKLIFTYRNDVITAMSKTGILGNASILNK